MFSFFLLEPVSLILVLSFWANMVGVARWDGHQLDSRIGGNHVRPRL